MDMLLVAQAALAVAGLVALNRRVFPALGMLRQPELVADVWAPLALVLPLVLLCGRVGETVRGVGWAPIGGPVCVGALAVGASMIAGMRGAKTTALNPWALVCWAGGGFLLLLLGAVHDLMIWTGQVIFALAAVLLWMNTPPYIPRSQRSHTPAERWAGVGMLIAICCALGQGIIGLFISDEKLPVSVGLMMGYGAAAGAGAARLAGWPWSARIAGWAATIGLLLGIGAISLLRLLPLATGVALNRAGAITPEVAHSFGIYAVEATMLLLLPVIALVAVLSARFVQVVAGIAVIGLCAALAAWRVVDL